jgi:hypothetical protein
MFVSDDAPRNHRFSRFGNVQLLSTTGAAPPKRGDVHETKASGRASTNSHGDGDVASWLAAGGSCTKARRESKVLGTCHGKDRRSRWVSIVVVRTECKSIG